MYFLSQLTLKLFKLGLALFLILFFASAAIYYLKSSSLSSYCVFNKNSDAARFQFGESTFEIPRKYLSICKNREGSLAVMDLVWPELVRKPKFDRNNRDELITKRLMISLVAPANNSSSKAAKSCASRKFEYAIQQTNVENDLLVYSAAEDQSNGFLAYFPINSHREKHLQSDIYVKQNEGGEIVILLNCKDRVVGGRYCENPCHSAFDDFTLSYSFDSSHLNDAARIDEAVKHFIESMRIEN